MKFFVPQAKPRAFEDTYRAIADAVKDQMRMPIGERRIHKIEYTHDKKLMSAEVGKLDPQRGKYEVVAIFESKPHVIVTKSKSGESGPMMLVTSEEITSIQDFE